MKKIAVAIACLGLAGLTQPARATEAATAATADTETCVTHAEFDATTTRETVNQIAARFDVYGFYLDDTANHFRRGYKTCWAPGVRQAVVVYSYDTMTSIDWYVRDAP